MTDLSMSHNELFDEIHDLVTARLHGELTSERLAYFDRLLAGSVEARQLYVQYIYETLALPVLISSDDDQGFAAETLSPSTHAFPQQPDASPFGFETAPSHASVWSGLIGQFSSGWPVAYLVATVILGVGFLIGTFVHVSQPAQIARPSVPLPSPLSPLPSIVGRITGMVDCQWADPNSAAVHGSHVPLGREYSLASGLMEITYDSGAKAILQGPATYKVESHTGGYLSLGKLTARVEKRGEGREERGEDSALRLPPSALFSVRTPTATVTDLGTEFGVEVSDSGATLTQVFRGRVEVERKLAGRVLETVQLAANEAVRIDAAAAPAERLAVSHGQFVTEMPRPAKRLEPVAWYSFDEVTGGMVERTPDSSRHGRSATLQEMDRSNLVPGKAGSALKFNVDENALKQRVTLPWSPAFDMVGESFTIALWLNRLKEGTEEHETIFHKEAPEGGYSIMRERDSGCLVFRARNAAGQWVWIKSDASDDAPEGVWVHFAVVGEYRVSSGLYNVRIYRNGICVGQQGDVELAAPPLPLSIGGLENGWAFRGLLDDIQVYHSALNDAELKSLLDHPGELPLANASNTTKGGE